MRLALRGSILAAALAMGLWLQAATSSAQTRDTPQRDGSFERPSRELVVREVRGVLSEPRFRPKKNLWQWTMEKLSSWSGADSWTLPKWTAIVFWIFSAWCLLALIAVLVHICWSALRLLPRPRLGAGLSARRASERDEADFGRLQQEMEQLAAGGNYRDALQVMLLALIRRLADMGILGFHRSKTNGDYLREFPRDHDDWDRFRRFVIASDTLLYSAAGCGADQYQRMHEVFEGIRNSVEQQI